LKPPLRADPRIEKLRPNHALDHFDCGREELNRFLQRRALQSQQSQGGQTYVGLVGEVVVGFYTLVSGSVAYERASDRLRKGLGKQDIPIVLLARLAVDRNWQGQSIGASLLKDAMLRTISAADIVGIRAMVVHAKDDRARAFYEHFDFIPSPTDPLHLYVLLKDVKKLLQGQS
jgi:GNAT superfamily N-acetyltransferase